MIHTRGRNPTWFMGIMYQRLEYVVKKKGCPIWTSLTTTLGMWAGSSSVASALYDRTLLGKTWACGPSRDPLRTRSRLTIWTWHGTIVEARPPFTTPPPSTFHFLFLAMEYSVPTRSIDCATERQKTRPTLWETWSVVSVSVPGSKVLGPMKIDMYKAGRVFSSL